MGITGIGEGSNVPPRVEHQKVERKEPATGSNNEQNLAGDEQKRKIGQEVAAQYNKNRGLGNNVDTNV